MLMKLVEDRTNDKKTIIPIAHQTFLLFVRSRNKIIK